jgi:glycosyltransferase involved in cell wall biosynthesis
MNLSIIIPLYNEEHLIVTLLEELQKVQYPSFVETVEIVVVDDASSDRSFQAVQNFAGDKSKIKLLQHTQNQGKGAAVKTGVKGSAGDCILIQDADMELSPVDIPSLVSAMHELKVPFVNGSRYLPGVLRTQAAFKRYFANKFFTMITSMLIDVHLTDMACGYKLISRELFEKLNLRENRFGFEAELIIKCGRIRKNWIAEVPVHYIPRNLGEGKKLRNADGFRIFKTILKYGLFRVN